MKDRNFKVLVVSNNPFSKTSNNGKTLASFFENFNSENIFQLYFSAESPNKKGNYFQITDSAVIKTVLRKEKECGRKLQISDLASQKEEDSSFIVASKLKKSELSRIIRELFWRIGTWKNDLLDSWLKECDPDVIFFCAGDSGFAYDVVNYIQQKTAAKSAIYITDDYILPRRTLNLFWWWRRNFIFKKMKLAIHQSDGFATISEKMRDEYKSLFGKDSKVLVNMTPSLKMEKVSVADEDVNSTVKLTYAGGLHFNRDKVLVSLINEIQSVNGISDKKIFLDIYSVYTLSDKTANKLTVSGVSSFKGKLNPDELKIALNKSDVLVHVESFDSKSIESTRLSLSTKIPEYLSIGKPILAIGPPQLSSMQYLADVAVCANSKSQIEEALKTIIFDSEQLEQLSKKSLQKYEAYHSVEDMRRDFKAYLMTIYRGMYTKE